MTKYSKSEIGHRAWNAKINHALSRGLLEEAINDAANGDGQIASIPFRLTNLLSNISDIAKFTARYNVELSMKADDIDPMNFALTFWNRMEDDSVTLHARLDICQNHIRDRVQERIDADATGNNLSIMISTQVTFYPETDAEEAADAGITLATEIMHGWHIYTGV